MWFASLLASHDHPQQLRGGNLQASLGLREPEVELLEEVVEMVNHGSLIFVEFTEGMGLQYQMTISAGEDVHRVLEVVVLFQRDAL